MAESRRVEKRDHRARGQGKIVIQALRQLPHQTHSGDETGQAAMLHQKILPVGAKAGGFAPLTPTGEPPGAISLRGRKFLGPRSDIIAPGGSPVGVEGAKPPAFLT
jgi:hypothetical protein